MKIAKIKASAAVRKRGIEVLLTASAALTCCSELTTQLCHNDSERYACTLDVCGLLSAQLMPCDGCLKTSSPIGSTRLSLKTERARGNRAETPGRPDHADRENRSRMTVMECVGSAPVTLVSC